MTDDDRGTIMKSTKSSRPDVSVELEELLDRLDLSPSVLLEEDALAICDNSSSSSGPGSIRNADSASGYPEQFSTSSTVDRRVLLEEFSVVRAKGEIYVARNGFFHDKLVEHFKRKQMMRVYEEANEEDPLKNRNLKKKLLNYENLRQELQAGEEELKTELNLLRDELRKKTEEADAAVDELVGRERAAGAQSYTNGKPLAVKEIQLLITRELLKIKEISKVRVRYARLRDALVEKEVVFDALNILTPNLDQKDYERLEAENFHYKHELRMKERACEILARRRDHLSCRLKSIKHKRNKRSAIIRKRRDTLHELKRKAIDIPQLRLIRKQKIEEIKNYFEKLESILGLHLYPEVWKKVNDIPRQRDEWLKKVAGMIRKIKRQDECLNALGAGKAFHQRGETTDDEDSNDGISYREKSRRPPLGGGFLQAL